MTRVIVGKDCGNSPRNPFLEKLTIACARGDAKFILGSVTDAFRWGIVGRRLIHGQDDFGAALERMKSESTIELIVKHVATHGKTGAANGTAKLADGRLCAFCATDDFDGVRGARVKEITPYVIDMTRRSRNR